MKIKVTQKAQKAQKRIGSRNENFMSRERGRRSQPMEQREQSDARIDYAES